MTASSSDRRQDKKYYNWGPRRGVNYGLYNKTVLPARFGIYYAQVFYGGFGEGAKQGFDYSPGYSSVDGRTPAFYWDNEIPAPLKSPPFHDPALQNHQGIDYIMASGSRPSMTCGEGKLSRVT